MLERLGGKIEVIILVSPNHTRLQNYILSRVIYRIAVLTCMICFIIYYKKSHHVNNKMLQISYTCIPSIWKAQKSKADLLRERTKFARQINFSHYYWTSDVDWQKTTQPSTQVIRSNSRKWRLISARWLKHTFCGLSMIDFLCIIRYNMWAFLNRFLSRKDLLQWKNCANQVTSRWKVICDCKIR